MKLNKFAVVLALFAFVLQAFADQQEPAYWMKKYTDAPHAKQLQCLAVAEEAYNKANTGGMWGDNGFAVLAKGTAWEACMENRK